MQDPFPACFFPRFALQCAGTEHPAIRNVSQAYIQGLSQNLAFFLAKSGQQVVMQLGMAGRVAI